MQKRNLLISIIFSGIALINLILFVILSSVNVVGVSYIDYLFFLGAFLAIWVPNLINKLFKVNINFVVALCYQIFLFLSIVIGSVWKLYNVFDFYDIIMHFTSGVLIVIIAYSVISNSKNISANLFWTVLVCFSIAMMGGAVWEIWEFSCDGILGYNAQHTLGMSGRNAIMDTMIDLVSDFAGAIFASIGIAIVKHKANKNNNAS